MREELRGSRPPADGVFNFGPDIETLRARCQEDTGLPAPRQPVWREQPKPLAEAAE
jgi:N-methylhydantoinase B